MPRQGVTHGTCWTAVTRAKCGWKTLFLSIMSSPEVISGHFIEGGGQGETGASSFCTKVKRSEVLNDQIAKNRKIGPKTGKIGKKSEKSNFF